MPILDSHSIEFVSRSAGQTRRLGMRLGSLLQPGDLICLSGDLGAGKTTLVQGIAHGWGSLDSVTSPTFVLVNLYRLQETDARLYHLDAYRLQSALEAEDLDLVEMLDHGSLIVEWPERIDAVLPAERLWVDLHWLDDQQRSMVFTPHGLRYEIMLKTFRQRSFGRTDD